MPQINDIRELAQQNARYVSNSPQDWMSYLDVAARLYRYSFTDALLIHAQRPDATACAEMELWNQKMSRWVNRGAKGIALLDDTGPRTKLRYLYSSITATISRHEGISSPSVCRKMVRWWALLSAADPWRGGWTMAIRWKLTVCVRMERQTPAASCMRRRTVQHGQWVTTELLPIFWKQKTAVR